MEINSIVTSFMIEKILKIDFQIYISWNVSKSISRTFVRGHKGQNSTGTQCRGFLALESRCRGFLVLESRCRGFLSSEKTPWNHDVVTYFVSVSRCRRFLILESRCRGFLVLESQCCGFLVLEFRCRGICASTASFSFSLNLLCHIINVNVWTVNYANYFVSHKLVF